MNFSSHHEVSIVLGLEADCSPKKNNYWRMGYSYPIQLTQWALASAAGHPILFRFMETLQNKLEGAANRNYGHLDSFEAAKELRHIGPLSLTGPVAVTIATMDWLHEQFGLRWNALTGLRDGGRSKLIDDVLILPITGFRYDSAWNLILMKCADLRVVLVVAGMAIWARNLSRILRHAYGIGRRVHGNRSIPKSNTANFVAASSEGARIGRNSRTSWSKTIACIRRSIFRPSCDTPETASTLYSRAAYTVSVRGEKNFTCHDVHCWAVCVPSLPCSGMTEATRSMTCTMSTRKVRAHVCECYKLTQWNTAGVSSFEQPLVTAGTYLREALLLSCRRYKE